MYFSIKKNIKPFLKELDKWYYNIAGIMNCHDGNIEANIIHTLLQDDKHFNETLEVYEKISKDEYINNWTNKKISFNKEIQMTFSLLVPKLKEIRAKIKTN